MSIHDKFVVWGDPEPENIFENTKSLSELCLKNFKEAGESVLLIDGKTSEQVTGNQLYERCVRVAQCLQDIGIGSGDSVGICSENRLEFAYVYFGSIIAGATFAPVNTTYTEREIIHALNLSKPKLFFASPAAIDRVQNLPRTNNFISKIIVFNEPKTSYKNFTNFTDFIGRNRKLVSQFQCKPQDVRNNVGVILCSSGTTGLPKGVQLTEYNLVMGTVQHFKQVRRLEENLIKHQVLFGVIPWFHAFGCISLLGLMLNRLTVVFLAKFEEVPFLSGIQKYQANTLYLVPPLLVFLAKSPLVERYNLSSVKVIWCGAAPLSKELQDAVQKRIGVPIIRQGYGMTEGSLSLTGQTDDNHKAGSVGILRAGIWARVLDIESGENLGPHKQGELIFKGSCIMKGYIGDAAATKHTIDPDGWLHTGDIGYYDEDNEFFVVDRLKELIKYKGFQVPPAEIEALLLQHPQVKDVGVIGVPDDEAGELPMAFVVKQENSKVTERDILSYVAAHASAAKRLHGGVRFVKEIPKNPSGKILRRELRDLYKTQSVPTSKL